MYSGMAEEEDKKTGQDGRKLESRRGRDPCLCASLSSNPMLYINSSIYHRLVILSCCRLLDFDVDSGPPTEPTGYLQLLPSSYKHLPDYRRPKSI